MWVHYVIFIIFIVLSFCGGGGKIKVLVDVAKSAGLGTGPRPPLGEALHNATKEEHKLLQTEPFDNSSAPSSSTISEDLPCLDKLVTLEDRIQEADFIFTGKVQWIGGTITHRGNQLTEKRGPGGRIGGVSVSHFLKGGADAPEREFLVEGFESPLLCESRSRVREEWIFLVSKISGKHVGLVSSLQNLRLKNLRRIQALLEPRTRQPSLHQQKGPALGARAGTLRAKTAIKKDEQGQIPGVIARKPFLPPRDRKFITF